MAFIDEVAIRVVAGAGGNGCRSFRREKYIPYGGPNGGNGGRGGSVQLVATHDKGSLLDFKYQPKYEAARGEHGKGSDMDGRAGEDLLLQVPVGTMVYDSHTNELLEDLNAEGKTFLVAKGGRGGRGNKSFVSSTNRAPRKTTPGEAGAAREIRLELRLIADVGLVGLPNAGKSSLLRAVSRAEPKVADYAFTTLEPNLGVVSHKGHTVTLADLPGLIEGAAGGAGLGHKFLKHACRTRILLHLVDLLPSVDAIAHNVEVVRKELHAFQPDLLDREELLVYTKGDLFTAEDLVEKLSDLKARGLSGMAISSHSGAGIEPLLDHLISEVGPVPSHAETANVPTEAVPPHQGAA